MILAVVPQKMDSVALWSSMGWVDVVLLVAFLLGIFFGIRKGLAKMLKGLIEIIAAQVIVVEYTAALTALLAGRFQVPTQILNVILFASLAFISILIIWFIFKLLSFIVDVQFKQPLNHLGGALAGGLQFILFFSLIAEFLMLFQVPFIQESFQQKSLSGPYLIQICEQVHYIFERWIPVSLQA